MATPAMLRNNSPIGPVPSRSATPTNQVTYHHPQPPDPPFSQLRPAMGATNERRHAQRQGPEQPRYSPGQSACSKGILPAAAAPTRPAPVMANDMFKDTYYYYSRLEKRQLVGDALVVTSQPLVEEVEIWLQMNPDAERP